MAFPTEYHRDYSTSIVQACQCQCQAQAEQKMLAIHLSLSVKLVYRHAYAGTAAADLGILSAWYM